MTRVSYGGDSIPTQTFFNLDKDKQQRIVECAIDEFSVRDFETAKLSNIIKNAQIPRGSLYQYFKNKKDLYLYLMDITAKRKMSYLGDYLTNPMELPFFDLFHKLYLAGIKFAMENSKLVKMTSFLLQTKGEIYDAVFSNNIHLARDLYQTMIQRDQKLGRIRKDIDSGILADMVIDMTINISVSQIEKNNEFNYDKMLERVTQVMKIFEHGVMNGE